MDSLTRIQDSTTVHSFPGIYNQNIETLEQEIASLHTALNDKETEINDLKTKFNSALNALRAEYIRMIDELKTQIEDNQ